MQFNPNFFEPPPLSPDLEWMLQSNQVSDAALAVQLAEDYASRLHFLALVLLGDESASSRAVAHSLQYIVKQRAQYWGQIPLRAWIYAQALRIIRRQMTLLWRLRRWADRKQLVVHPLDRVLELRLALLRLDSYLVLPVALVYGHELPENEAAYVLDISEEMLNEALIQARQHLPEHTQEELEQAARLAEAAPEEANPTGPTPSQVPDPAQPHLQRRLLSQVLPNLTRQTQKGRFRRVIMEVLLVGLVVAAGLLVGWSALMMESNNPERIEPTPTKPAQVIGLIHEITATPRIVILAQSGTQGPVGPRSTPTPEQRVKALDLSSAVVDAAMLEGETNQWENSGPVLLAVLLKYLNFDINAIDLTTRLRPNPLDATIFPYEIEDYVANQTHLEILYRFGGEIEILRRLIDARLPVLLQRTYSGDGVDGWAAEYALVTGFDDFDLQVTLLTVRSGTVQVELVTYEDLSLSWLPFGYAYFVIYPRQREADVRDILGGQFYDTVNYEAALDKLMTGFHPLRVERFWQGFAAATLMTYQQQYANAVIAYTQAFDTYERLPEDQRPWRIFWYNSRPYWAFYYVSDYNRVITLAEQILETGGDRGLEESLYWRAMAHNALGNQAGAIEDAQAALQVHPNFGPALYLLEIMQASSP